MLSCLVPFRPHRSAIPFNPLLYRLPTADVLEMEIAEGEVPRKYVRRGLQSAVHYTVVESYVRSCVFFTCVVYSLFFHDVHVRMYKVMLCAITQDDILSSLPPFLYLLAPSYPPFLPHYPSSFLTSPSFSSLPYIIFFSILYLTLFHSALH